MGLSGGSTSRQGSGQKWAQPLAQAAAGTAKDVYNANQPGLSAITTQVQGMLPGLGQKYAQGNPALNAAQGYAKNVLGGQYLSQGNPYIQQMIDSVNRDVTNQVGAAAGSRGSFGGSAWQQNLTKALAEQQYALRYGDYSAERQNQQQAMSAAPQLAAAEYAGIQPLLATAELGAKLPYTGLESYTGALGTLMNGGVTKQSNGIGGLLQGVGQLASGGAAIAPFLSDDRVKVDIRKVGEDDDGLGVYDYRYIWDEPDAPLRRGVMAQEVEKLRPWALGPEVEGFKTVNYHMLEAR